MKNKFKLYSISIIAILIVMAGIVYLFRVKILKHFVPTVEQIGDVHISVQNDTIFINSLLSVKNNSFLKIEIDSIRYKVSLFHKTYLHSKILIGRVLHGYGTDTLSFYLKIPYVAILKDLSAERLKGDSASYSINISLKYSTIFGKAEFPVNKSARLKIPQPPEIKILEIKYTKIRLKSIHAIAKIKIINYSKVTLSIKELNYSMYILKEGNLKGNFGKSIDIKPNGTTFISLPIEINMSNLGRTLFEVIVNRDNYDYTLSLKAVLESSYPFKQSFHIDLTNNGKMELKK